MAFRRGARARDAAPVGLVGQNRSLYRQVGVRDRRRVSEGRPARPQQVSDLLDILPPEQRRRVRRATMPRWIDPMLATLTKERFSDPDWIFEHKLDGERCLAFKEGPTARLLSRSQQHLNNTYPEVADALGANEHDVVIDGEIVAFDGKRTSFEKLQGRIGIKDPDAARRTGIAVFYYVFDLMYLDGFDVRPVALIRRKSLLPRAVAFHSSVRFLEHRNREGEALYRDACREGLEGLIAKRRESHYVGLRSLAWLKFKCVNEQELGIGG